MVEENRKRRRGEHTKSDKSPWFNTLCFAYHELKIGLGFLDPRVGGLDKLSRRGVSVAPSSYSDLDDSVSSASSPSLPGILPNSPLWKTGRHVPSLLDDGRNPPTTQTPKHPNTKPFTHLTP
jgi:hypothetical protein